MSQIPPPLPPETPARWAPDDARDMPIGHRPPGRKPRGFALIAWAVITITVVGMVILAQLAASMPPPPGPAQAPAEAGEGFEVIVMKMQMKLNVGAGTLDQANRSEFLQQSAMFNSGPVQQRLLYIPVVAELGDSKQAAETLSRLLKDLDTDASIDGESSSEPTAAPTASTTSDQDAVIAILNEIYPTDGEHTPDAHLARVDALADADRTTLVTQLGWLGELALVPPGSDQTARDAVLSSARTMAIAMVVLMVAGFAVAGLGFIGLIVLLVMAFAGKLRSGIQPGHVHHGIYAETFALWLIVFLVCQLVGGIVAAFMPDSSLGISAAAFFVSMIVLAYPVVRGVASWREVREDIGLTLGRQPLAEPFIGVGGYMMGIPIGLVGILLTLGLMLAWAVMQGGTTDDAFAPGNTPAHPIIGAVGSSTWAAIQLFLVASVAAPVVEETMFRGVLYRHLRDASRGLGLTVSILLGTFINAFVFAAIHPQGILAIPALMSLAVAFTLAREWRGTLIPSMIMHGVSNGIIMTMLLLLVGS